MVSSAFGATVVRLVAGSALSCALLLCGGETVRAQGIGSAQSFSGAQGAAPTFSGEQLDRSLRAPRRPPAALPGAAGKEAIAPPTKIPKLMSPTEELFDSINRGDMANVRDALSRGADLSAANELGLTPLDLSIDLGRNDISFLLLSMRDASPARTGPAPAARPAEATRPPLTKAAQRSTRELPSRILTKAAEEGQPSLPKLFAGDGGAPVPRAGFLGFDGR